VSAEVVPAAPAAPSATAAAPGERDHAGRRPALDGIRALAVTAVVVYHFGGGSTSWLPGGFLGVDVFFVLSGYLITGLLLAEYARRGGIDLPGFWVRRARRLMPALIAMLLAVVAWIWWATPLESYPMRRTDVFWTVGYLANWHLIKDQDDYFAAYSSASPLRHTWSLAIEEQFYLAWPLLLLVLLWLGHRLSRRLAGRYRFVPVIVAAGVGVLLSALAMATGYNPDYAATAYYSTQDRVQELFVGVLLAVLVAGLRRRRSPQRSPAVVLVAAGIGLGGLVIAFARMSDTGPFYYRGGALAVSGLVAVLIAALDLFPGNRIARAFSWRPAVALGRISYGVYLWHWPLVLAVPVTGRQPIGEQIGRQALRLALTLLLAGLSFRYLEQPVQRDRRWLTSKRRVFLAVLASSSLVVGLTVPATALPGQLSQERTVRSDISCPGGEQFDRLISCTMPTGADATATPPKVMLLGDSVARSLGPGLDEWARNTGNTWVKAAWRRCPSTGVLVLDAGSTQPDLTSRSCHTQAPGLIRQALSTYHPDVVLIAETWTSDHPILVDGANAPPGTAANSAALRTAFGQLADEIASYGSRAVFVALPPVGDSIGAQYASGRPAGAHRDTANDTFSVGRFNDLLRSVVASRPKTAQLVSITDVVCPGGPCPAVIDGTLVRGDGTHYTTAFAQKLVPILLSRANLGA
jgi:peptidoglycan/LPS O-acetylase OafA/YrhL